MGVVCKLMGIDLISSRLRVCKYIDIVGCEQFTRDTPPTHTPLRGLMSVPA